MANSAVRGSGNLSAKGAPGTLWLTPARMQEILWWSFGRWLATRRKEAKLSATAAAHRCGISVVEWRWIEKGISETPIELVLLTTLSVGANVMEACLRYRISGRERKAALGVITNGRYGDILTANERAV